MVRTVSAISLALLSLVWWSNMCLGLGFIEEPTPDEVLETSNFYLMARPNFAGSFWIIEQGSNKIIGHAPWDPVKRRYTLFDLRNEYHGFMQATMGQNKPDFYKEFLWYDKENRYKGVFIRTLGGRPTTPDLPFGELGGMLWSYSIGNVPIPQPSYEIEVDPLKRFPEGVDISPVQRGQSGPIR